MTRFLITDPGTVARTAKNENAAPGLPNQPENHSGRTPMVGTHSTRCGVCDHPLPDAGAVCELCAAGDLALYTPHQLNRLIDTATEHLVRERLDRLVGLVNAELVGHVYRITDYPDADTGEPMQVIAADDIPLIVANVRRRMHAPAFGGSLRGER